MRLGIVLAGVSVLLTPGAFLHAQTVPPGVVGWYNGDWSGYTGARNSYVSSQQFYRIYDDFTVPEWGWTVTVVFVNSHLSSPR